MFKRFTLAALLSLLVGTGLFAQNEDSLFVREHYEKMEVYIPMRDGTRLFTSIYLPKDQSVKYPVLMQRTPYSARPYGEDAYKTSLGPSRYLMQDKYIFVYQDVRGRWMSEGDYDNMRPHIKGGKNKKNEIDESSDTYDTIEWLLKNLKKRTNGKVGQWGISYPGFYTAAALPGAHPALVASSPQAPIGDFFFDDFIHHGAFLASYWRAMAVFGYQTEGPTQQPWYQMVNPDTPDDYAFFLELGTWAEADKLIEKENFFWEQIKTHTTYDEFWQKRSIFPHLKNINHAVMTVAGWYDAEDLYGPFNIYKAIERNNQNNKNTLVVGPWSHGDWSRERGYQAVGNIYFGDSISTFYQKNIERPFFNHYLKGGPEHNLPEAYLFDTGAKEWKQFEEWPLKQTKNTKLYFKEGGALQIDEATDENAVFEYISDPNRPVPDKEDISMTFTPRKMMTDDQRFAARRPDVLSFVSEPLADDMTISGEIMARLKVSTSGTDADWVVKLVDVFPGDHPNHPYVKAGRPMGDYHKLVRFEVFRGRFRNSYEQPEAFIPDEMSKVEFPLQDVLHTFKKGHRIMIQIQSTMFPYIDRNPQNYVENIFEAKEEDYTKATMRIHGDSYIEIGNINYRPPSVKE